MFKEQVMETLILIAALSITMVIPLQSSRKPTRECGTAALGQVRHAFQTGDLDQAERLAELMADCPEAVGKEATRLLRAARLQSGSDPDLERLPGDLSRVDDLMKRGEDDEARRLLAVILEKHPGKTEARALLLRVDARLQERTNARTVHRLTRQARQRLQGEDFAGALQVVDEAISLQGQDPLLMELRRTIEVARISHEAGDLLDSGEAVKARLKVGEALSLQSSGPLLKEWKDSIGKTQQKTRLRLAVRSYYAGEYAESVSQLKDYLEQESPSPFRPLAYFYLGASVASASLLADSAATDTLETAREHFRTSRYIDTRFNPPLEAVSPRIQALFTQAVGDSK